MRLLFFGSPDFAVPALRRLHEAGHDIALVVTRPDRPRGRSGRLLPTPVRETATELGLSVYQPPDANAPDALQEFRETGAELGVVVAYGQILSPDLLATTEQGFINVHASLLPAYRGAAPINWAVMRGETETGVSIIRVLPKLDAGPVLAQTRVEIGSDETAGELAERLAEAGAEAVVDVVDRLDAGEGMEETPQPHRSGFFARKLTKPDGQVDWSLAAEGLRNRVRGLTPWPGACCRFQGSERETDATLIEVRVGDETAYRADARPGQVVGTDEEGIAVQTGCGVAVIARLKPAGGRAMHARDFANGYRVKPGDAFC